MRHSAFFTKLVRVTWRPLATLALAFTATVTTQTAHADPAVSVILNAAPLNVASLVQLDEDQKKVLLYQAYKIPYDTVEPLIDQALKDALAAEIDKQNFPIVKDCPGYCGDAKLWVNASSSFKFTQKGQPQVQIVGPATDNRIKVTLQAAARVEVQINLRGVLTDVPNTMVPILPPPPHDEEVKHKIFIKVDLPVKVNAQVKLWPTLNQESFSLVTDQAVTVTDNDGVQHELAQQGAQLGMLVGMTPEGLALGGSLPWSIAGFLFGNAAGEMLQDMANKAIAKLVSKQISTQTANVEQQIKDKVDLAAKQGKKFLDETLATQVPGTGNSMAQLQNKLGLTLDVRLHQSSSSTLSAVATARYKGTGNAQVQGAYHFPKSYCAISTTKVAGGTVTNGVAKPLNEDLKAYVGQPCSVLGPRATLKGAVGEKQPPPVDKRAALSVGPIGMGTSAYLGAIPPGSNVQRWQDVSKAMLTGTLVDKGTHYECGFNASGMAETSAIKLSPNDNLKERLGNYGFSSGNFLVLSASGKVIYNSSFDKLKPSDGIVFGGIGPSLAVPICYSSVNISESASKGQQLKMAFDPEKCPQCLKNVTNPGAVKTNPAATPKIQGKQLQGQ